MVDFGDSADMQRWLRAQPREVAVVMAARAALRVLPIEPKGGGGTARHRADAILRCFRAAATAWVAGKFPTHGDALRDTAAAAGRAANTILGGYSIAAASYAAAAACDSKTAIDNAAAASYAAAAAGAGARAAGAADAAFIERAGDAGDRRRLAITLAGRPLWPDGTPNWAKTAWSEMRAELLGAREGWDVWIELYDALLTGSAPSDPAIALAYVTPAAALWEWESGPQGVNAEIKRLLAEAQNKAKEQKSPELPEEAALPHQSLRAAIFTEAEGGVIGIAPSSPQGELADTPEVRDFYEAVCEQIEYLVALGPNMLGQRLHQAVTKFQQCLPGSFEKAIERRVWSRGNALRVMLNEHDATASDPTHPHRLEPSAAETLRGFVQVFNQLTFADPSLRSRDARRPGPQEVDHAIAGLRIAVEFIPGAAADRAITNSEAAAELSEQIDIAEQLDAAADSSLPSKVGREHAAETVGNFVSHAILRLRNAAVNVTKEVTSGFFRQAGATIFVSALQISPAITNWFIANSEQLLAFGATFFEHAPAFRETVEWLREHIVNDDINNGRTD